MFANRDRQLGAQVVVGPRVPAEVLVSMMLPPEVNRPTMVTQRRGLAKIFVQPPKPRLM
jgi:hypothetical protein